MPRTILTASTGPGRVRSKLQTLCRIAWVVSGLYADLEYG
jgi:hypothetical protein